MAEISDEKENPIELTECEEGQTIQKRRSSLLCRWAEFIFCLICFAGFLTFLKLAETCGNREIGKVSKIGIMGEIQANDTFVSMKPKIDEAFAKDTVEIVLLHINSPGGSFMETAIICYYIHKAVEKKDAKVVAFVDSYAESAGYLIACLASEIFIKNNSTSVGSIGAMKQVGDEYIISGKYKNPHLPRATPKNYQEMYELARLTHDYFIDIVQKSRKQRLRDDGFVFEGQLYEGEDAVDIGLVDGILEEKDWFNRRLQKNCYCYYWWFKFVQYFH